MVLKFDKKRQNKSLSMNAVRFILSGLLHPRICFCIKICVYVYLFAYVTARINSCMEIHMHIHIHKHIHLFKDTCIYWCSIPDIGSTGTMDGVGGGLAWIWLE